MSTNLRFLRAAVGLSLIAIALACSATLFAQTTISTGSIQGAVSDPSGALVGGATVSITQKSTGRVVTVTTSSAGAYASGALTPGDYVVRIEAKGFKVTELGVKVEVGVTATGDIELELGANSQVIEVAGSAVQVNTEQATVQGVIDTQQIENLPTNGRNFLDLAQLEPGVQIQDGGNFDPTKKGFDSISFGGRFGRTARIEVDGIDVSDETVGTTTQDIPESAIQEFQIGQSSLDLSTELTSSGSVNVTTRSGTNDYHGESYYYFRDQDLDADLPGPTAPYFQRNQYGGNFGGPLLKDKLFFFVDGERTIQGFDQPVLASPPFNVDAGSFGAPFKEGDVLARADWQITNNFKMFYRFSYNDNNDVSAFVPSSFQPMDNITHSRDHVVGLDFTKNGFSHSIRFGYMKFYNHIASGVTDTTPFNPTSPIELSIGSDPLCIGLAPITFCAGQPFLAPQATPQSDHQLKYDGSKVLGSHVLRYGGGWNHIQGGGFAGFLADGPAVNAGVSDCPAMSMCAGLPGGEANALNYPALNVILGNGEGFETSEAAFGFPGGGLGPDNRLSWYVGDSWKLLPNFTLTYGLRYVRDTGRSDSDLGPIPALNQFDNQFYSNLGRPVRNPDLNFAPQLGIAWDPTKHAKTVIRAGIGLFYENAIWNNVLFDRPARLTEGSFLETVPACSSGSPESLPFATAIDLADVCGAPIGSVQSEIATLEAEFHTFAEAHAGPAPNPSFIGSSLSDTGPNGTGTNLFYPGYQTPRSLQMNAGIQHEIRRGMVFTADYLRNVATHTLLAVDTNHVGDARFFNLTNAQAAVAATLAQCGVASINAAIANCPGQPGGGPATISTFAVNGLDSGYGLCGGAPAPCGPGGTGPLAAFPGINQSVGGNQMLFPVGRSVYNGLQLSLKQDVRNPLPGIRYLNLQVSYALSRYVSMSQDSDFINSAWDAADPTKYMGPDGLDRLHQISFGGFMELPENFRLGLIGHFYSPLAQTLTLATTGAPGGIFVTDINGDGTGDGNGANGSNGGFGGILPGTNLGSFGRGINASNINVFINNYNNNFAGKPTPAGQDLITANLFTLTQLQQLGGVMQPLALAPPDEANDGWLRDFDVNLGWTYKIRERVELQPGISFLNLMNFANFDPPKNTLMGVLSFANQAPVVGSVNGTPGQQPASLRVGLGAGVFGLGSPRVIEFSLKMIF
jgi:hypothetical protein